MNKELLNYVTQKTNDLLNASSCCPEAKAAGQAWLSAAGTAKETEETARYIAELEADITSIDGLIAFSGSDAGASVFGADAAAGILAHAKELKAAGAKFCDCPACTAAAAILSKKDELLK